MSNTIIRVNTVSKRYRIGASAQGYKTFRESIMQGITAPLRNFTRLRRMTEFKNAEEPDVIWALKDVSFEVKEGDVLGVIGKNGAGKTTILKILSRITEPTSGYIEMNGRVSSLLEVGTGFHPELTGRENVFLNGAILGMGKKEIERKFDDIVNFAEIEKFIDTPVKHFSSGMYVRLAFAVAAHLEPEILLVDEVLAVGDAQFQKKSLGKMGDIARGGRTVLFVSHNMAAVNALCNKCILLEKGRLIAVGDVKEIVNSYLTQQWVASDADIDLTSLSMRRNSIESSLFKWTHIKVVNSQGMPSASIELMEPFDVIITGVLKEPIHDLVLGLGLTSGLGFPLFNSHTNETDLPNSYPAGKVTFRIKFDPNLLGPGMYILDLGANGSGVNDWIPEAVKINIEQVSRDSRISIRSNYDGIIIYPCKWVLENEHIS